LNEDNGVVAKGAVNEFITNFMGNGLAQDLLKELLKRHKIELSKCIASAAISHFLGPEHD
jgi:hypothetical protein